MGNYENLKQSITEVIRTNGNKEITGAVLQSTLLTIISTVGANATFAGIATPTTNPGTPDGSAFWLASESGTYSNFGSIELQDGLSVLTWNGSWSSQQIFGIDDVPTAGSDNLVKSGGVFNNIGAFDISELNATENSHTLATYEDLASALNALPDSYRKSGMSVKFVQSSDNKYVQYRLMSKTFNTNVTNWQGVDTKPIVSSKNLVESGGVFEKELISHFSNQNITPDDVKVLLCDNIELGNRTIAKSFTDYTLFAGKKYYIYIYLEEYDIDSAIFRIDNGNTNYMYRDLIGGNVNQFKIHNNNVISYEFTPKSDITEYTLSLQKNSLSVILGSVIITDNKEFNSATSRDLNIIGHNINDFAIGLEWLNAATDGDNGLVNSSKYVTTYFSHKGTFYIQYNDNNYQLYCRVNSGGLNTLPSKAHVTFSDGDVVTFSIKDKNTEQRPLIEDVQLSISQINLNRNEVDINLENGVFDGGGDDADSTTYIRTQKISCNDASLVIAICPETMDIMCNFETESQYRTNLSYRINAGISVSNPKGFIRFGFRRRDGSELNISNLTEEERNGIRVYSIRSMNENEIKIAAYNSASSDKENADIICTDANAQFILNACLSCIGYINIKLAYGSYNLYKLFYSHFDDVCTLKTQDGINGLSSQIKIGSFGVAKRVTIAMSQECFALCSGTDKTSMLLVPCRNQDGVSIVPSTQTYISIQDLDFVGYDYTKPIIVLDLAFANKNDIQNFNIRCDKYELDNGASNLHTFRTAPHQGCIGCRVGFGSNDGYKNKVKSGIIWYVGKGVSCAGEHYIFEDVLTHHCYIGWAFGDYHTTGSFEHPNIMIGCSIEGCYRFMYLTKGGITTEGEFVEDGTNNIVRSTLICIGLSTEIAWAIPLDEVVEGGPTWQFTLPILEVLKGAYRGRIEIDTPTNVFENGSGRAFTWRKYDGGHTILGHGNTVDETYG